MKSKHGRLKPRWIDSLWNWNNDDFKDAIEEQNLKAEIIHSESLELKPKEPYKNMTEEKNKMNQASTSWCEEKAEKYGASAVMILLRKEKDSHWLNNSFWILPVIYIST